MNITRECVHFLRSDKSTNNTSEEEARKKTLAFITRQSKVLFILCAFTYTCLPFLLLTLRSVPGCSFSSSSVLAHIMQHQVSRVFGTWQEPTSLHRSSIKQKYQIHSSRGQSQNEKKAIFTANFRIKKKAEQSKNYVIALKQNAYMENTDLARAGQKEKNGIFM